MTRKRKKKAKPQPSAPLITEGTREQYLFLPLTLLLAIIAYKITLCPTVYVSDSGTLATAAYYLGIPHSPGYPLYCLLGWVFTHLPIGDDIAYRLNVMSAVFAVGTVLVLYMIIYHFTRTPYLSFSVALAYAFSPVFWSQAVIAEVYTLNTFLTALALYFLCRWLEKRKDSWLFLASFTSGLAVSNHQLAFLLLPTGLYMLWIFGKGLKTSLRFWLILAGLYFLGLLVYLYLPIRASADPPLNWGNPSTIENFINTLIKPVNSQVSSGSRIEHFFHALKLWVTQFGPTLQLDNEVIPIPIIWMFGIWGIYKGLSTGWRMARVFIVFMLLNLAFILFVSRPSEQGMMLIGVYYLPVFMVFAVFMATGLREWLKTFFKAFGEQKRPVLLALVILILVLIPLVEFYQNRPEVDRSHDYYARDYGTAILKSVPENGILLVNWDDLFTLWYLQKVEGVGQNVDIVLAEFPIRPGSNYWGNWLLEEMKKNSPELFKGVDFDNPNFFSEEEALDAFVVSNLENGRDVYLSFYGLNRNFDMLSFRVYPVGPIYKAGWEDYGVTDLVMTRDRWERIFDNFRNIDNYRDHRNEEEDFIIYRLSDNLFKTGQLAWNLEQKKQAVWFLEESITVDEGNVQARLTLADIQFKEGNFVEARDLLLKASEIDPSDPRIFMLLGLLFKELGQPELAIQALEKALHLDPIQPDARAILDQIRKDSELQ